MSRPEQDEVLAAWGNLSLEERLADRTRAAMFAAEHIRIMAQMDDSPSQLLALVAATAETVEEALRGLLAQLPWVPILTVTERDNEIDNLLRALDARLAATGN